MLHCNMNLSAPSDLFLGLEDVLANLHHARRREDLGRLALLTYWDVRKWARSAHRDALADRAFEVIAQRPHPSRSALLALVDEVIVELERIRDTAH